MRRAGLVINEEESGLGVFLKVWWCGVVVCGPHVPLPWTWFSSDVRWCQSEGCGGVGEGWCLGSLVLWDVWRF